MPLLQYYCRMLKIYTNLFIPSGGGGTSTKMGRLLASFSQEKSLIKDASIKGRALIKENMVILI